MILVSRRNLSEIKILRPQPRPAESNSGCESSSLCLPGDSGGTLKFENYFFGVLLYKVWVEEQCLGTTWEPVRNQKFGLRSSPSE